MVANLVSYQLKKTIEQLENYRLQFTNGWMMYLTIKLTFHRWIGGSVENRIPKNIQLSPKLGSSPPKNASRLYCLRLPWMRFHRRQQLNRNENLVLEKLNQIKSVFFGVDLSQRCVKVFNSNRILTHFNAVQVFISSMF